MGPIPIPNPHILEIINFNKFYKLIEKYKKKLPFLKNVKSESNLQNSNYSNKLTRVYFCLLLIMFIFVFLLLFLIILITIKYIIKSIKI